MIKRITTMMTVVCCIVLISIVLNPIQTLAQPGTIIIEKQIDPDGALQSFEFSTSYAPTFS